MQPTPSFWHAHLIGHKHLAKGFTLMADAEMDHYFALSPTDPEAAPGEHARFPGQAERRTDYLRKAAEAYRELSKGYRHLQQAMLCKCEWNDGKGHSFSLPFAVPVWCYRLAAHQCCIFFSLAGHVQICT